MVVLVARGSSLSGVAEEEEHDTHELSLHWNSFHQSSNNLLCNYRFYRFSSLSCSSTMPVQKSRTTSHVIFDFPCSQAARYGKSLLYASILYAARHDLNIMHTDSKPHGSSTSSEYHVLV